MVSMWSNRVDSRTLTNLSPTQVYQLAVANRGKPLRDGPQIYIHSFGAVPVLFCAPYVQGLYCGNGAYGYGELYVARLAYELAQACGATVLYPLSQINHPSYRDEDEDENPLIATLTHVMQQKRFMLFIEVHATDQGACVYFDTEGGVPSIGFDSLYERLSRIDRFLPIERVHLKDIEVLKRHAGKSLLTTLVRKAGHIPALTLYLKNYLGVKEEFYIESRQKWDSHDHTQVWTDIRQEAAYHIPQIAAYCHHVKTKKCDGELDLLYRSQFANKKTQPLLPLASTVPALPPGSENGVVEADSTLELLDRLYDRYGGGQ